jgi:hypothetical protein
MFSRLQATVFLAAVLGAGRAIYVLSANAT